MVRWPRDWTRCAWVWACLVLGSTAASAQDSPLASAEVAFERVAFDDAREAARLAVKGGQLSREALARAYEIIAVSAAAVGNSDEARAAYLLMHAIDPTRTPSGILPPSQNRVFFDTRGYWQARERKFGVRLRAVPDGSVEIEVMDPISMAATLEISQLPAGQPTLRELGPAADGHVEIVQPAPAVRAVEAVLRDSDGNELSRAQVEVRIAAPLVQLPEAPPPIHQPPAAKAVWRSPWLWASVGVVVVAAAAGGTWFLLRDRPTTLEVEVATVR